MYNGNHNSVSPCDERTTSESPRVGAEIFPSLSICLCTHRNSLSSSLGARRSSLFVLRLHGIPETQSSLLWARRNETRRGSAKRRVPYEPEKPSPLTSRDAMPLSGESMLNKHQCAMGKSFGFQPHSGFSTSKCLPFFLIFSDCRCGNLIKRRAYSARSLQRCYNYRFVVKTISK